MSTSDTSLFYDVFNASPVGIVIENLEGQPLFANPAFCSFLGFGQEELGGKHCVDFSPAEDAAKDWALFQQLRAGVIGHYQLEKRYFRRDGSLVWGRLIVSLLKRSPSPLMVAIVEDITDKKKAEEARFRLAAIVESSNDAIISKNLDAVIVGWNAGAERIFGYTEAEVVGQPITILIPPELQDEENKILEKLRAGGRIEHYETKRLTKAGRIVDVSLTIGPIKDSHGGVVGFSKIAHEITERKQTEEAAKESEERFRLVADTAPVLIWMSGQDRLCTYFNKSWLDFTGRPLEAELGNGWTESVHADDLASCLATYTQSFDRHEPFEMQYRLRRRDGEYRWILDIGVPRFIADSSFIGYIGSCIDITERKLAEETLASLSGRLIVAQEEERRRIAREIHDDYTQRLALLAFDLEELAGNLKMPSVDTEQRLHEFWNRASELGADLHSLSHRLHSSTLENLGLVAGTKAFCEEFADQQEMQIDFSHEKVPQDLASDVALCLFRVLQEGLRNVKRHSGANLAGVRLESIGDRLHLSVSDQGRGFDARKRSTGGGIGIRSMEERLRLLGGRLEVHSGLGRGTRIEAWLPSGAVRQP